MFNLEERGLVNRDNSENNQLDNVFHFLHFSRADLFLYDVYQSLTLTLPPGGLRYEYAHYISPESALAPAEIDSPEKDTPGQESEADSILSGFSKQLINAIESGETVKKSNYLVHTEKVNIKYEGNSNRDGNNEVKQVTILGGKGISSGCAHAIKHDLDGYECFWFEMGDFTCCKELEVAILRALYNSKGLLSLYPTDFELSLLGDEGSREPEQEDILWQHMYEQLGIDWDSTIIFITGRTEPGLNAGWGPESCEWHQDEYRKLAGLLKNIAQHLTIHTVYLPHSFYRSKCNHSRKDDNPQKANERALKHIDQKIREHLRKTCRWAERLVDDIELNYECNDCDLESQRYFAIGKLKGAQGISSEKILQELEDWVMRNGKFQAKEGNNNPKDLYQERRNRLRFLFVLTLFRQSRHQSALVTEASVPCKGRFKCDRRGIEKDNDYERYEQYVCQWIDELIECRFIRPKAGAFYWIHSDIRKSVQEEKLLEWELRIEEQIPEECKQRSLEETRARSHHWIAEWYFKAFQASNHPIPLVEALYHHLQCLKSCGTAAPSKIGASTIDRDQPPNGDETTAKKACKAYRRWLADVSFAQIMRVLRVARPEFHFWFSRRMVERHFYCPTKEAEAEHTLYGIILRSLHDILQALQDEQSKSCLEWGSYKELLGQEFRRLYNTVAETDGRKLRLVTHDFDGMPWDTSFEVKSDPDSGKKQRFEEQLLDCDTMLDRLNVLSENVRELLCACRESKNLKEEINGLLFNSKLEELTNDQKRGITQATRVQQIINNWLNQIFVKVPDQADAIIWKLIQLMSCAAQVTTERAYRWELLHNEARENWIYSNGKTSCDFDYVREYLAEPQKFRQTVNDYYMDFPEEGEGSRDQLLNYFEAMGRGDGDEIPAAYYLWNHVCALSSQSLRLLSHLPVAYHQFCNQQNVDIRLQYGLALGKLGRLYEAQRKINEAHAYILNSHCALDETWLGIVGLRRAEVHLTQTYRLRTERQANGAEGEKPVDEYYAKMCAKGGSVHPLKDEDDILRMLRFAHLDDAWVNLDEAEARFSDTTRSVWWWSRLYCNKLRCLAEIAKQELRDEVRNKEKGRFKSPRNFHPLANRKRINRDDHVKYILSRGLLLSNTQPQRHVRMIYYALVAQQNINLHSSIKPDSPTDTTKKLVQLYLKNLKNGTYGEIKDDLEIILYNVVVRKAKELKYLS